MPVLELIILETLRITGCASALVFRRDLLEDITISGGFIKPGDFVAYSMTDVHLNPYEFDPSRPTRFIIPGREDDTFSYLG